jgi:hypothetical protein
VRWLLENELVDEINLLTFPVIIGQGTRLFADTGPDVALDLVDARTTPNGVTIQVFGPAGDRSTQRPPRTRAGDKARRGARRADGAPPSRHHDTW